MVSTRAEVCLLRKSWRLPRRPRRASLVGASKVSVVSFEIDSLMDEWTNTTARIAGIERVPPPPSPLGSEDHGGA